MKKSPDHGHSHEHKADKAKEPLTHWSTLEEFRGDPEVERLRGEEFFSKPKAYFDAKDGQQFSLTGKPNAASEAAGFVQLSVLNNGGADSGLSRRDFLKISGFAAAFATAGCALRPVNKIIPYVKAPEDMVPGVANYYASTLDGSAGVGVVVKTREGRPIKVDGNPDHPISQGKLHLAGQAALFNLYDPARLQKPVKKTKGSTEGGTLAWTTADEEIGKALSAANGKIALLTSTVHGPARAKLLRDFTASFPGAQHVMYDPWSYEGTRSAQEKCFGSAVLPRYRFDRAEYILVLNADPLGSGFSHLEWSVEFGKNRKVRDKKFSKLVVFEPFMSQTGANADQRFKIKPADALKVGLSVANYLLLTKTYSVFASDSAVTSAVSAYVPLAVEKELGLPANTIKNIAEDLWANKGKGLVFAADNESLQIVANLLNAICENEGRSVEGTMSPSRQSKSSYGDILNLISDMKAGKIDVLITYGTNPAFTLPESLGFADALKRVKTVISLNDRIDETAVHADFVLPGLNWLENWGDAEPQAGLYSLTQPCIYPLWDNRGAEDSLLSFARAAKTGALSGYLGNWHQYLMDTWKSEVYKSDLYLASFESFWNSALRDGVLNTVIETEGEPRKFLSDALASVKPLSGKFDLELVVYPSPNLGDGSDNNNAWLLETPDPVSRITWLNYASMSPKTAQKLGVGEGDIVTVEANGVSKELPAHLQPGDTDDVISIQTGWGRTHSGEVGNGAGVNAFAYRKLDGNKLAAYNFACKVTKTGKHQKMPCVQGHDYLEGRPIIAEAAYEDYLKDHKAGQPHKHELMTLWSDHDYSGYRWGMSIDLSSCIGCNACMVACMVENNIPVVGMEEIIRGREMHWIRIDRYYSGDVEQPEVTFQPMLCQHCENAPCETVCPVVATTHNDEGLNVQTYNRCVGTRYCSNNCPYKVRRFNWYESAFIAYDQHPLQYALNPDVTVREKGIMEKCTFCVQKIRDAKQKTKELGRKVTDSDLKTACQQTCPTDALVFGDINNPDALVSKWQKDDRSYRVLEELNVKPSITYLTKLRNRPAKGDNDSHGSHGKSAHKESKGGHS